MFSCAYECMLIISNNIIKIFFILVNYLLVHQWLISDQILYLYLRTTCICRCDVHFL